MSVFIKSKPAGVDITIQAAQKYLYAELNKVWATGDSDFDCYGRVYRNQTEDGFSPEFYDGKNEYKEVLFDDRKKVLSFFGMGEKQDYNGGLVAQIYLVFLVTDLTKLRPGIAWRPDEEVRTDVELLCHGGRIRGLGFTLKWVETGIDNVLKDFSGWNKTEGVKYRDMQPFHCFRLNFNLLYTISNC